MEENDSSISRFAAIDALDGEIELTGSENVEAVLVYVNLVVDRIKRLPSVQPERKKGKWIDNTYCSECGWAHETEPGFIGSVDGFNFCPQRGADNR